MTWAVMNVDEVPEIRKVTGVSVETLSDLRINRLLRAHNYDMAATTAAVQKHIEFSMRFNTDEVPSEIEDVLRSRRFLYLGVNADQIPVVAIDWMRDSFLDVPGGIETLLKAYVVFMRRTSVKVKSELGFPQMEPQFMLVGVGFTPPMYFLQKWTELRAAHFPVHVTRGVLHPIDADSGNGGETASAPPSSLQMNPGGDAGTMLEILSIPADLISGLKVNPGFFPNELVHTGPPAVGPDQAVISEKSESFSEAGSDNSTDASLTEDTSPAKTPTEEDVYTVRVKNTFINLKSIPESEPPVLRRRHSFCGVSSEYDNFGDRLRMAGVSTRSTSLDLQDSSAPHCLSFIAGSKFVGDSPKDLWATLSPKYDYSNQAANAFGMAPSDDFMYPVGPEDYLWAQDMTAVQFRLAASNLEATARMARAEAQRARTGSEDMEIQGKATKKTKGTQPQSPKAGGQSPSAKAGGQSPSAKAGGQSPSAKAGGQSPSAKAPSAKKKVQDTVSAKAKNAPAAKAKNASAKAKNATLTVEKFTLKEMQAAEDGMVAMNQPWAYMQDWGMQDWGMQDWMWTQQAGTYAHCTYPTAMVTCT